MPGRGNNDEIQKIGRVDDTGSNGPGSECGNGGSGLGLTVPGKQGEFIPESPALKHIHNDLDPGGIHQVGGGPDIQRIAPGHHQAFLHKGKPHDQCPDSPGHFPAGKGHIGFLVRLVVQVQAGQVGFAMGQALCLTLSTIEIPLGILTAVLGAPFFLYLLARGRKGWS